MKLTDARLCLNDDCGEIFTGPQCPACACDWYFPIERWMNRQVRSSNEWIDALIEFSGGAATERPIARPLAAASRGSATGK